MDELIDINEALIHLKNGELLACNFNDRFTYIKFINVEYYIKNENLSCYMDEKLFEETFKRTSFKIIEDSDNFIDENKDREYYSWRQ